LLTHRQTDKQTDKQTKSGKNITSLAEVVASQDKADQDEVYDVSVSVSLSVPA